MATCIAMTDTNPLDPVDTQVLFSSFFVAPLRLPEGHHIALELHRDTLGHYREFSLVVRRNEPDAAPQRAESPRLQPDDYVVVYDAAVAATGADLQGRSAIVKQVDSEASTGGVWGDYVDLQFPGHSATARFKRFAGEPSDRVLWESESRELVEIIPRSAALQRDEPVSIHEVRHQRSENLRAARDIAVRYEGRLAELASVIYENAETHSERLEVMQTLARGVAAIVRSLVRRSS